MNYSILLDTSLFYTALRKNAFEQAEVTGTSWTPSSSIPLGLDLSGMTLSGLSFQICGFSEFYGLGFIT